MSDKNEQQAPSATVNSKFTINDDYEVIDEDGINRTQYARSHKELRESLAKLSDVIDKSQQAPSATVDLPAIKTLFAKWCNAKTEDTHSNAMTLNAFAVAVAELLHSQQPTVDVEEIARECVDSLEEAKLLEVSALTERINLSDREDAVRIVSKALTEALRGSYTREDMKDFLRLYHDCEYDYDEALRQYDTERGMKNG